MEFPRPVKLGFSVLETPPVLVVRVRGMDYSLTNPLPPVNTLVAPSMTEISYGGVEIGTPSYLSHETFGRRRP